MSDAQEMGQEREMQKMREVEMGLWNTRGAANGKGSEGRLFARSDVAAGARDAHPCWLAGKPFRMGVQKFRSGRVTSRKWERSDKSTWPRRGWVGLATLLVLLAVVFWSDGKCGTGKCDLFRGGLRKWTEDYFFEGASPRAPGIYRIEVKSKQQWQRTSSPLPHLLSTLQRRSGWEAASPRFIFATSEATVARCVVLKCRRCKLWSSTYCSGSDASDGCVVACVKACLSCGALATSRACRSLPICAPWCTFCPACRTFSFWHLCSMLHIFRHLSRFDLSAIADIALATSLAWRTFVTCAQLCTFSDT